MERIRKENQSPVFNQFKRKCSPVAFADSMVPEHSQHSIFTFEFDKNASGFHVMKGVSRVDDCMIAESGDKGVIVVDLDKRRLLKVNEGDLSGVKHNEIVDLNEDGDRWEGDVLNGKPCGWGVLYNKDNFVMYEGFRVDDLNVCYGRSYYADVSRIEYEGEICEGLRWGEGTQYDRNGDVVYEGKWVNDEHDYKVVTVQFFEPFHSLIEQLVVSDYNCNREETTVFDLSVMPSLKSLKVGNKCFIRVKEVRIVGLKELESVVIGEKCFTRYEVRESNPNHHFYLKNCPKLKSLKIGSLSFCDYTVCEIENVDALEVIKIGKLKKESSNFYYASLELKSILIHHK